MTDIHSPWDVLQQTTVADYQPWLRVQQEHVRLPNGVEIPDYYRIEMPAFVAIFALTPENNVIMVRHYKHGPQMVSLEIPAGYIESGDDEPLVAAQRELKEETGYEAAHWHLLGNFFIDGNRGCGEVYAFVAIDAEKHQPQALEETELISVEPMAVAALEQQWLDGKLPNIAVTAITGLALAYLRQTERL